MTLRSTETPMPARAAIGVFDSGVGGLSVLRHLRAQLPQEDFCYFADGEFAPYGEKPEGLIVARSLTIAAFLREHGVKALVVACNTATAAAIDALRLAHPDMPVVGVEPGLKPAAALSRSRVVGVLATEATLASNKFARLRDQMEIDSDVRFLAQACNGLADRIESGELRSAATALLLRRYIEPLLAEGADTLVLGCTHYPFVQPLIKTLVPAQTQIVDTGAAVASQLARLLAQRGLQAPLTQQGALEMFTSGSRSALAAACTRLLQIDVPATSIGRMAK